MNECSIIQFGNFAIIFWINIFYFMVNLYIVSCKLGGLVGNSENGPFTVLAAASLTAAMVLGITVYALTSKVPIMLW